MGEGMVVCKPVQWSVILPQPTVDVGWLLSMLMAGMRRVTPHSNTFSDDVTPRKTEVSLEQWYHEGQCVKNHYPGAVGWESIIELLKGTAVDMARYMGPNTSIYYILNKLSVIFGTVALLNVVMQNFTRWARGIMKRFPLLPQDWRGPSTKFSSSVLGGWQT